MPHEHDQPASEAAKCPWCDYELPLPGEDYSGCPRCYGSFSFRKPVECGCVRCLEAKPVTDGYPIPHHRRRMVVCSICGNKRCPKAEYHGYACSGSNATGQTPVIAAQPASEPILGPNHPAIVDATPRPVELPHGWLKRQVDAALGKIASKAEQIEDGFNADDYDGDLDVDELAAEVRWHCIRTIRAAMAVEPPASEPSGREQCTTDGVPHRIIDWLASVATEIQDDIRQQIQKECRQYQNGRQVELVSKWAGSSMSERWSHGTHWIERIIERRLPEIYDWRHPAAPAGEREEAGRPSVRIDARLNGRTPWDFACGWYTVDEIHRSILSRHKSGFVKTEIPSDIESREFADWLTEQYRLAMWKGIEVGQSDQPARLSALEASHTALQAKLDAVAGLVEKWRLAVPMAVSPATLDRCADELESALAGK
jgi:hypothetical protein